MLVQIWNNLKQEQKNFSRNITQFMKHDLMEKLMQEIGFRNIISDSDMSRFRGLPGEIVYACNLAKQKEQGFLIAGYKQA